MDITCHKCGHTADHLEFTYLCKNGCPACGESDLRRCPRCGAECVFSRAESLENEEQQMEELSRRLAAILRTNDPAVRSEAKELIARLSEMNKRWNIPQLQEFIMVRQRELLF
jgi:predicted  nucleic acid-binding Zn-ribbon protein